MRNSFKILVVAAAIGSASSFAHADAIIDLFGGVNQVVTDASTAGNYVGDIDGPANAPLTSIIGGNRDLFIKQLTGPNGSPIPGGGGVLIPNSVLEVKDGALEWSNTTGTTSEARVRWDGDSTVPNGFTADTTPESSANYAGLGGVDLTSLGSAFQFTVAESDTGFFFEFFLYSTATEFASLKFESEAHLNEQSTPIPILGFLAALGNLGAGPVGSAAADISLCGATGCNLGTGFQSAGVISGFTTYGFDLTNIDMIEIVLTSGSGAAGTTDLSVLDASVIPEPGTLALAGLTLVGLALQRRRKYA